MGSQKTFDDIIVDGDDDNENMKLKQNKILEFLHEQNLTWSIKLRSNSLCVKLPDELCEGSKEKFVDLLEFADDELHCNHVIIYFDKTRSDRASLVKTFMFLGFHILSPNNKLSPSIDKNPDYLSMVYIIDSDQ